MNMRRTPGSLFRTVASVASIAFVFLMMGTAQAQSIRDPSRFFSPGVVKQVEPQLAELAANHNVQMIVETFATIPPEKQAEFHSYSPARREIFFTKWAKEQAASVGARDVYVLVCKKPGQFNVEISRGLQVRGFTLDDRDAFRNIWLAALRAKERDLALEAAVQNLNLVAIRLKPVPDVMQQDQDGSRRVAATAESDSRKATPDATPRPGKRVAEGVLKMAAVTIVGLVIVLVAAGFLMNGMLHPMGDAGSDSKQGDSHSGRDGGWTGGMLAGIVAALFGGWYYNSMPASGINSESDSPTFPAKETGCCRLSPLFGSDPNREGSDSEFPYTDFRCGDIGGGDGGSF
jgi:hypothetical protein